MNTKEFFAKYRNFAIDAAKGSKIFPETILAAASVESGNGKSGLSAKYNNFFGIKADSSWKGKKINLPTKEEFTKGKIVTINQYFRVYESPVDSFRDYVKFVSKARYKKSGVLDAKNPKEQFEALKKGGYATASNYVDVLLKRLKDGGITIKKVAVGGGALLAIGLVSFLVINSSSK